jgi:signal transduction histidine kinase
LRIFLSLLPTILILTGRPLLPAVLYQTPAVMHYPAAIIAAWVGGLIPGLLSTLACSFYSVVFLRPHLLVSPLDDLPGLMRSLMFLSTSIFFTLLITALQRGLLRVRNALRLRNDFLSVASHELKTPITSLFFQAQIRERKAKKALAEGKSISPDELHKMAAFDLRQLARLNQLIENMLDVTRISSGQRPFQPVPADFALVVKEAAERFRQGMSKGELHMSLPATLPGEFDILHLDQIVTNLLSNAYKYGEGKTVAIRLTEASGKARLEVEDQGPGISSETREKIFQKFERFHSPDRISGMGLGLFICRDLAERQGGRIDFESEPGKGATFFVELPLTPHR